MDLESLSPAAPASGPTEVLPAHADQNPRERLAVGFDGGPAAVDRTRRVPGRRRAAPLGADAQRGERSAASARRDLPAPSPHEAGRRTHRADPTRGRALRVGGSAVGGGLAERARRGVHPQESGAPARGGAVDLGVARAGVARAEDAARGVGESAAELRAPPRTVLHRRGAGEHRRGPHATGPVRAAARRRRLRPRRRPDSKRRFRIRPRRWARCCRTNRCAKRRRA